MAVDKWSARLAVMFWCACLALPVSADTRNISSLGRIEPEHGVYRLAGPAERAVVAELLVAEGDQVAAGATLARLDDHAVRRAQVQRAEADLAFARRVLERNTSQGAFQSVAAQDQAKRDVQVREADLMIARAQLARATINAPVAGQVLAIHARQAERIGADGLLELGNTQRMYVVAEVYETDIGAVAVGQRATATSPALATPVQGTVERIGQLVARNDVLALDPVARTDARVIEVFVLLDEPEAVATLTNLQVQVEIEI